MREKSTSFLVQPRPQQQKLDSSNRRGSGRGQRDPACAPRPHPHLRQGCLFPLPHSLSSFSISTVRLLASTMTRYSGAASTGPITVRARNSGGCPCPGRCPRSSLPLAHPHPPHILTVRPTHAFTFTSSPGSTSSLTPQAGSAGPPVAPAGPRLPPSQQALPPNCCLGPADLG